MTDPMAAAFVTAFATPSADDTCAPTFQGLSTRSRSLVLSEALVRGVDSGLEDASCIILIKNPYK